MTETAAFPLPTSFQTLLSMYGYFLPIMLYAVWSALAFWDLGRRQGPVPGGVILWLVLILVVPFFGALAYHLVGKSEIPRTLRIAMVGGGVGVYLLVLIAGRLMGGIT